MLFKDSVESFTFLGSKSLNKTEPKHNFLDVIIVLAFYS